MSRTLRPQMVPERALGRVGGLASMRSYGLMPLGALTAGLVGTTFGLVTLFVAVSGFLIGVGLRTLDLKSVYPKLQCVFSVTTLRFPAPI